MNISFGQLACFSIPAILLLAASPARGQAGTLDPSFDGDGLVTTNVLGFWSEGTAVAVQPDGRIVVGGRALNGPQYDFAVLRYLPDGSLDNTFGNNGIVVTAVGESTSQGNGLVIQPDGKIILAGTCVDSGLFSAAVVRYESDGALDATFGQGGVVITSIGPSGDEVNAVALQPDGKIVVAGWNYGTIRDVALARYHPDGTLDATFSGDGKLVVSAHPVEDGANDLVVQDDGKILVGGFISFGTQPSNSDFLLIRFTSDGVLDGAFGNGGIVQTHIGSLLEAGLAIGLQSDQKILLAGTTGAPSALDIALLRYEANGALDSAFGINGLQITPVGTGSDFATGLVVQPDDRVVVVGGTWNGLDMDLAVARYQVNGDLDPGFGTNGIVVTPASIDSSDQAQAVALQPDGKVVVVGGSGTGAFQQVMVARYLGDPNASMPEFHPHLDAVRLYPSLLQDHAVLEYELSHGQRLTCELINAQGRLERTLFSGEPRTAGPHRETIDLTGLAAGGYSLVLSDPDGMVSVRFVKQ